MSQLTNLEATRKSLQELAHIVQMTRRALAAIVSRSDNPGQSMSLYGVIRQHRPQSGDLTNTLEHIEGVREGFILSQRLDNYAGLSVLRDLVEHVLLDWEWLQNLNLGMQPSEEVDTVGPQLIFFNHALIALGMLPRLPAEAVTFPQRRPTYSDVKTPAEPGELLERIEEIERTIYHADLMPNKKIAHGPLRRTYAFFEASNWLVNQHLRPLL